MFSGKSKTVTGRPSKIGQRAAADKLEAFYLDPKSTEVYNLHAGVIGKWRPPVNLQSYEQILKQEMSNKQQALRKVARRDSLIRHHNFLAAALKKIISSPKKK